MMKQLFKVNIINIKDKSTQTRILKLPKPVEILVGLPNTKEG